jgi:lactate dehydrogenase-like 2-hydroxyacid dehydrogenase
MEVGYFGRSRKPDVPYRYFDQLGELAAWCDVLVICAPSDQSTYHAVDGEILARLGPGGFVINVSRGALLDSNALMEALRTKRIAGAGLDVIEGEPAVPEGFKTLDNLVLSPHVGGFSPEAIRSMIHRVRDNLDAHFAGKPPLTPVP